MVRLIDIAKAANVSSAVVSAVLSSRNGGTIRVAPETAEKIRNIAREMNYVPNVSARILNGKSSGSVGVLLDSCAPNVSVRLLRAVEHELSQHKFRTLVAESHDSAENLFENYNALRQYGVDGVICLSHDYPGQNEKVTELFSAASDIVFVRGPEVHGHPLIRLDVASGIRQAVAHLFDTGRKKLMLVTQKTGSWGYLMRSEGFQAAAGDAGIICQLAKSSSTIPSAAETGEICRRIREEKVDGVIARNDFDALALITALQERGIRVPEDVAVTGSDDEPFARFTAPSLTTINYNLEAIAGQSVAALLKKESIDLPIIQPELIIRNSTGKTGDSASGSSSDQSKNTDEVAFC